MEMERFRRSFPERAERVASTWKHASMSSPVRNLGRSTLVRGAPSRGRLLKNVLVQVKTWAAPAQGFFAFSCCSHVATSDPANAPQRTTGGPGIATRRVILRRIQEIIPHIEAATQVS